MGALPEKAFILAAGKGTRLRPYTDHVPKPMVEVASKPIIGHALDHLAKSGVRECVVNTHYRAKILHDYLAGREESLPRVHISHENDLLDTGGGVKAGLKYFGDIGEEGDEAFFVINGDAYWDEMEDYNMLRALADFWDGTRMDIAIMLQPVERMELTQGVGDYDLSPDGRAIRNLDKKGAYMFTSVRMNAAHIFDHAPKETFSYLTLLDRAQESGRLYGVVHEGDWHHISTPQDLEAVNAR